MKREHAMALFGLFKMKAESAAATWFIVMDFLGMYKMLLWEKNKTEAIWSIVHEAECRRNFLIDMGNNNLDALKLFIGSRKYKNWSRVNYSKYFMQKRNHQRKKLRGKLRKCKIARRHNSHLIVVLCNPFGFIIERAKYINLLGYNKSRDKREK